MNEKEYRELANKYKEIYNKETSEYEIFILKKDELPPTEN